MQIINNQTIKRLMAAFPGSFINGNMEFIADSRINSYFRLGDVPKDEEIVVLSMYDGIGTGRYCLDKMGFTNVKYYAYEIDKYAIQVAKDNYPDIIECGDAFGLRAAEWSLPI